jgi:hypothetical protein
MRTAPCETPAPLSHLTSDRKASTDPAGSKKLPRCRFDLSQSYDSAGDGPRGYLLGFIVLLLTIIECLRGQDPVEQGERLGDRRSLGLCITLLKRLR